MSKSKGSKDKSYRCNCGKQFDDLKQFIKHYRKDHPEDAISLYQQVGTVGDSFIDNAIIDLMNEKHDLIMQLGKDTKDCRELSTEHDNLLSKYNELVFKHNQLTRSFMAMENIMAIAKDIHNAKIELSPKENGG